MSSHPAGGELLATYLDLVAKRALLLAFKVRKGSMWPGDLPKELADINDALSRAQGQVDEDVRAAQQANGGRS